MSSTFVNGQCLEYAPISAKSVILSKPSTCNLHATVNAKVLAREDHGALHCRGHWEFFALWPCARWWHESNDAIHNAESTNVKHEQDDILERCECNRACLTFEWLRIFWNLTGLGVDRHHLSGEERDHTNTKCHQEHCICAKVHAHLRPLWRVTAILSELIHTHPVCKEEDGQHWCKGHR